jgi:hypothetical protein
MSGPASLAMVSALSGGAGGVGGVGSGNSGGGGSVSSGDLQTGLVGDDLALLERSCREELAPALRDRLARTLLEKPILSVERALDAAYETLKPASLKGGGPFRKKEPFVAVSKHYLDFGREQLGLGVAAADEVVLTNLAGCKAKFRVNVYDDCGLGVNFVLTTAPAEGTIKKKSAATIAFRLVVNRPCKIGLVIIIAIDGGIRHHLILKKVV